MSQEQDRKPDDPVGLHVVVPEKIRREVKAQAAKQGKSVADVVRRLLLKWLEKSGGGDT